MGSGWDDPGSIRYWNRPTTVAAAISAANSGSARGASVIVPQVKRAGSASSSGGVARCWMAVQTDAVG
jgi:hypothetical protein